jgi:hypothetical protein
MSIRAEVWRQNFLPNYTVSGCVCIMEHFTENGFILFHANIFFDRHVVKYWLWTISTFTCIPNQWWKTFMCIPNHFYIQSSHSIDQRENRMSERMIWWASERLSEWMDTLSMQWSYCGQKNHISLLCCLLNYSTHHVQDIYQNDVFNSCTFVRSMC